MWKLRVKFSLFSVLTLIAGAILSLNRCRKLGEPYPARRQQMNWSLRDNPFLNAELACYQINDGACQ